MKYSLIILLIFLSTAIISCIGKTEYTTPKGENIIPKDSLELIIYDVHLADAIITTKIMKTKNNAVVDSLIYVSVFQKYNYTREEFENTILYYIHNEMDTLNAIYDRIIIRCNIEKGQI